MNRPRLSLSGWVAALVVVAVVVLAVYVTAIVYAIAVNLGMPDWVGVMR